MYDRTLSGLAVLAGFVGFTALTVLGLYLLRATTIDHGSQQLSCKFICPIGFGMFAAISAFCLATLICTCGFQFCKTFSDEAQMET